MTVTDKPTSSPHVPNGSIAASPPERTQVFLVDDHPAIREALTVAINARMGMQVVGEGGTAEQALRLLRHHEPDLVVVDISLEDAHGLDLVQEIRDQFPAVRVVIFSMYDENTYAERAIRAGASGYVMKTEPLRSVMEAIQTVSAGEVYLSRPVASRILGRVIRQRDYQTKSDVEELTDRELTVFRMLGEGMRVQAIADQLSLSRKTVETYRRRAKEKLGFDTVDELLQYAVQWAHREQQSARLPSEE